MLLIPWYDYLGIVTITMLPDGQGRFGFNVKGGMDQGVPVIVSRVAGGTPADTCIPRLSEGDQVVMINGRDIGPLTHDQVNFYMYRKLYMKIAWTLQTDIFQNI